MFWVNTLVWKPDCIHSILGPGLYIDQSLNGNTVKYQTHKNADPLSWVMQVCQNISADRKALKLFVYAYSFVWLDAANLSSQSFHLSLNKTFIAYHSFIDFKTNSSTLLELSYFHLKLYSFRVKKISIAISKFNKFMSFVVVIQLMRPNLSLRTYANPKRYNGFWPRSHDSESLFVLNSLFDTLVNKHLISYFQSSEITCVHILFPPSRFTLVNIAVSRFYRSSVVWTIRLVMCQWHYASNTKRMNKMCISLILRFSLFNYDLIGYGIGYGF